jgi:hypothetical protein
MANEPREQSPLFSLQRLRENWYVPLAVAADLALIWHPHRHTPPAPEKPGIDGPAPGHSWIPSDPYDYNLDHPLPKWPPPSPAKSDIDMEK